MNIKNLALGYHNIALNHPKQSTVKSREECDTSVVLGKKVFKVPVLPANMKCTINNSLAAMLMRNEYFHILHRFEDSNLDMLRNYTELVYDLSAHKHKDYYNSISIGVKFKDIQYINTLITYDHKVDYITIDVAHGHSIGCIRMLEFVKKSYPYAFVIAGNVATPEAVIDLQNAGADAIKVGIGPGTACTTFIKTGFMSPMFTAVKNCSEVATVPIIADGGIRSNGDIVKALVAGADMVMVGGMFAQLIDSPAKTNIVYTESIAEGIYRRLFTKQTKPKDIFYKEFYGSASEHNKNSKKNIEGTLISLQGIHMTYTEKLEEIKQDLQSAISYAGGNNISALRNMSYDIIL